MLYSCHKKFFKNFLSYGMTHTLTLLNSTSIQSNLSQMESREARLSLNYAFSCLRYQKHLEELLIESGFLHGAPLPDELNSLVLVMLWEFVERKFVSRGSRSKSQLGDRIEEVLEVETNLEKVFFIISNVNPTPSNMSAKIYVFSKN